MQSHINAFIFLTCAVEEVSDKVELSPLLCDCGEAVVGVVVSMLLCS